MLGQALKGVYKSALPTLANNEQHQLLCDQNGRLLIGQSPIPSSTIITIQDGNSLAAEVLSVGPTPPRRISLPGNLWGVASLSALVSYNGTDMFNAFDRDGSEWVVVLTANSSIPLDPFVFGDAPYIQFRGGTTAVPDPASGADLVIVVGF